MKKKSELNKELYTPAEVAKELGISIIHSFSGKLYGMRKSVKKKITRS